MASEFQPLVDSLCSRVAADSDLSEFELFPLIRPSIRLVRQPLRNGELGLGASRIGGTPDLPPGWEWPRWASAKNQRTDKFGKPWRPDEPTALGFIAQIDLSAVPQVDGALPGSGWLYFFYDRYREPWGYDPADRGCCHVAYANPDRTRLCRSKPPADADPEHTADPCSLEARLELTLPDSLAEIEYGTRAEEAYQRLLEELARAGGPTQHRLLGHPQAIQNPMELECQLASNGVYCGNPEGYESEEAKNLGAGAADWRLLLQIDTDEDGPGWMWGDGGRIYFWIKNQDLAARQFENVWLILQCY